MLSRSVLIGCLMALLALMPPALQTWAAEKALNTDDPWKTECDYGITLALGGQIDEAESVFTSLLSHEPGSSRALTNLGNIQVIRNELDVALSFYERAFESDTTDGGILLNRSIALMLMGEEELARAEAREGIRMSGGITPATSLIGLRPTDVEGGALRAAEKLHVSKEEISALLSLALKSVPSDSTQDSLSAELPAEKKPTQAWRSAGARAAQQTEVGSVLYWKQ
jgi:tetratricopeptide (TPR) repeat protein